MEGEMTVEIEQMPDGSIQVSSASSDVSLSVFIDSERVIVHGNDAEVYTSLSELASLVGTACRLEDDDRHQG